MMLLRVERWGLKLALWLLSLFCGFVPSQNKVSRDPSSYVRLSVGTKTHLSKVRQLGVQPKTKEMGAPTLQGEKQK